MKLAALVLACAMTATAEEGTAKISCENGKLTITAPYAIRQITISYADVRRACTDSRLS